MRHGDSRIYLPVQTNTSASDSAVDAEVTSGRNCWCLSWDYDNHGNKKKQDIRLFYSRKM